MSRESFGCIIVLSEKVDKVASAVAKRCDSGAFCISKKLRERPISKFLIGQFFIPFFESIYTKRVRIVGRKCKNSPNVKVHGVPFRVTEMGMTTKGQARCYISMRQPDGSILHGEGVSKLVTAKSMKAEAVIKAAENIIWKNRGQVLEWLRAGRLQKATPTLLLLVLPEESVTSIYGKNDERRRELVRCAAKLLPPLPELQEKMEAVTFRAVEKVAVNKRGRRCF